MPYDDRDEEDLDITARPGDRGEDIPNYLTQAILVTLCCCWPFGIAAIVNAAKVNTLIAQGDYEGARRASNSAKTFCLVSLILGIVVGVLWFGATVLSEMNQGGFR